MIDPELLSHGIPNLGEAIPVDIYSELTGEKFDFIIGDIKSRKLLGVCHRGAWYVEAPTFCEEKLREIVQRRRTVEKIRQQEIEDEDRKRQKELQDKVLKEKEGMRQWELVEKGSEVSENKPKDSLWVQICSWKSKAAIERQKKQQEELLNLERKRQAELAEKERKQQDELAERERKRQTDLAEQERKRQNELAERDRKREERELKWEWERFKSKLEDIESLIGFYHYEPNSPNYSAEKYLIENLNYFKYPKITYDIDVKLFILPLSYKLFTVDELLTPINPPELPTIPNPPDKINTYEWLIKSSLEKLAQLKSALSKLQNENEDNFNKSACELDDLKYSLNVDLTPESICMLFEHSNKRHYLPEFLRKSTLVKIDLASQTMFIQFEFPDYTNLQLTEGKLKNESFKYLSDKNKKKLVKTCLYSLIIRAGYLASKINYSSYYKSIAINVEQNWFDPATGQPRNGIIASVHGPCDYFAGLDLSKLDPEACFKQLKGLLTPSLDNVSPIRPIFVLNTNDERFVSNKDIEDTLPPETNLASMDWEDFEHLVAQIFELEFSKQGVEVKVTRTSRDRGVDAILFDPDPLRGGKYVLQAKRYTRTVDVSAVRDLYGTVMNEGANRGILITTANFGPDSYEFVKDKPISLVDGPNLLAMLKRHGKNFRIDLDGV